MSSPSSDPRRSHGSNSSHDYSRPPTSSIGNPVSPSRSQGSQATRPQGSSPNIRRRAPVGGSHHFDEDSQSSPDHAHLGRHSTTTHFSRGSEIPSRSTTRISPEHGHGLPLHKSGSRSGNSSINVSSRSSGDPLIVSPPRLGSRRHKADSPAPKEPAINHSANAVPTTLAPVRGDLRPLKATAATGAAPGLFSNNKTNTLTVLNTDSRQTMDAESYLICYRLNRPSKNSSWEAIMKGVGKADFRISPVAILADLDWVIIFSNSRNPAEASEKPIGDFTMKKVATIKWHDVLLFLHSSALPKEQDNRDGIFALFRILFDQKRPIGHLDVAKTTSAPVLEIRSGTLKARHGSLVEAMTAFLLSNPDNIQGLEHYIKGLRVEVSQPRANKSQRDTIKPDTIAGLAQVTDSHSCQKPFPARVVKFGGGSKDVEFYYRRKGHYITVFDYFIKFKRQNIDQPDLPLVNIGTRSKPTYMPPSCCKLVEGPSQDALVLSVADLMQMVSDGITSHAKIPRWPSNGIDGNGIRSSGLKLPIADNMLNCQVTMTANALMTPCRVKMAPAIVYWGQKEFSPTSGSWTIVQTGIIHRDSNPSVRCKTAVLMIGCSRWAADEKIAKTLTALHDRLGSFGIDLTSTTSPLEVSMKGNKLSPKVEDDIKSKISTLLEDKTTAVVIMLSSRSKQVYEYVKKLCDVCLGIHSVCIDTYKLAAADNDNGYCFQTALKLNVKTGSRNQSLASPHLASVDLKSTMIVGIDVMIPPATTKQGTKPVVLMVSSINSDLSQWPSAVRVIDKQPLEQALADLLSIQISLWMKKNKAASLANFIIYHKGLTEAVCANEISSLRHTISKMTKQASFTLIAVNKDHHTKLQSLSCIDKAEKDKTIHSGAMITRSRNGAKTWEFLVQCHQPQRMENKASLPSTLNASKATLPTRYTVLCDDIFTTPKAKVELEDLTHDMQYLFGGSTAATSDTLPIHYLGLLRKRMELFLQPWYRPMKDGQKGRGKGPKLPGGGMSTETIRIHENIRDEMFYL